MGYFWVNFENKASGCVDADDEADAIDKAGVFGVVKMVRSLPYPAMPRLGDHDKCPPFCYSPAQCVGRGCCPKNPSCTNYESPS